MFAIVYLAIGGLVGALVRNPVNGTVLILFVAIIDIFFGPGFGSPDRIATRWLPTHFTTLWMVDLPSRHGGRLGDLGWALVWTLGALALAGLVVTATTRVARRGHRRVPAGWGQFAIGLRMGVREYRRNPVLWALLVVVPVVFIWLSKVVTRDDFMVVRDVRAVVATLPARRARVIALRYGLHDVGPALCGRSPTVSDSPGSECARSRKVRSSGCADPTGTTGQSRGLADHQVAGRKSRPGTVIRTWCGSGAGRCMVGTAGAATANRRPSRSMRSYAMVRPWSLELAVDRGIYRADLRHHRYEYLRANPAWQDLPAEVNRRNKRQLHGLTRSLRDGTTRTFTDPTWPYTENGPCPTCYSWIPRDSPCDHDKYECPTCGRRQCLRHWRYPMRSRREAVHFLKGAEAQTGRPCVVRAVPRSLHARRTTVWKIFTSERDYESYIDTGKHLR